MTPQQACNNRLCLLLLMVYAAKLRRSQSEVEPDAFHSTVAPSLINKYWNKYWQSNSTGVL